jgi:hypothetical protein
MYLSDDDVAAAVEGRAAAGVVTEPGPAAEILQQFESDWSAGTPAP